MNNFKVLFANWEPRVRVSEKNSVFEFGQIRLGIRFLRSINRVWYIVPCCIISIKLSAISV